MTKIIECDRCKDMVEWKAARADPYVMKCFERHTGHTRLYGDLCKLCFQKLQTFMDGCETFAGESNGAST